MPPATGIMHRASPLAPHAPSADPTERASDGTDIGRGARVRSQHINLYGRHTFNIDAALDGHRPLRTPQSPPKRAEDAEPRLTQNGQNRPVTNEGPLARRPAPTGSPPGALDLERLSLDPGPGGVVWVIARRPLRHPLVRRAKIASDRPRRLSGQPGARRLTTRRDLGIFHPNRVRSNDSSARASTPGSHGNAVFAATGKRCVRGRELRGGQPMALVTVG